MATSNENCIYKTVKMTAGETFVLPPAAELISVSNIAAVSSSCNTPLPEAEVLCYKVRWVLNKDPEGTKTIVSGFLGPVGVQIPETVGAWEDLDDGTPAITIDSVALGGQTITAGSNCRDLAALEATIASSTLSGAFSDRKYKKGERISSLTSGEAAMWNPLGDWVQGYEWFEFYFKSTAELASTVYLQFGGGHGDNNIGSIPRFVPLEVECDTYPTDSEVDCA